jgi:methionine-gamma-lyase
MSNLRDPLEALADLRHEFGEHGGVNMSIEASTTFTVMDPGTIPEIFQGAKGPDSGGCYLYGRHFNPTVYNLGRQLAALEGTESAYCAASGMGAIAAAILQACQSGDHIVSSNTIYGGTYALFEEFLPQKAKINATLVDINDLDAVADALTDTTRVIYTETISNPTLRVANIPELARLAQAHGALLIVDNTFSPLIISPAELGADVVVHSMTKFISGASDIIAGAVCANGDFVQGLMDLQLGPLMLLGPTMDPNTAFALSMRIPHLGLRMAEHSRRAGYMAEQLQTLGLNVIYPGLANHQDHALARKLFRAEFGFGGVLSLDAGTEEKANDLMERLQNHYGFGYMAVSLGYFDSLMSCSGSSTSSELTEQDKQLAGIPPGLVRLSIGYTGSLQQRWQQLRGALQDVGLV